jgi:selenophosphate synthetase-related protein
MTCESLTCRPQNGQNSGTSVCDQLGLFGDMTPLPPPSVSETNSKANQQQQQQIRGLWFQSKLCDIGTDCCPGTLGTLVELLIAAGVGSWIVYGR